MALGDCGVVDRYDGTQRRVMKVAGGATNEYYYEGWNMVEERSMTATEAQTNTYVWGLDLSGSLQGAGGIGGLITATFDDTNAVYYINDANGNITRLLDEDGETVAEYVYNPFGATVSMTGTMVTQNVYRFSSKYHDAETGHRGSALELILTRQEPGVGVQERRFSFPQHPWNMVN